MNSQPSLRFPFHIVLIYFITGALWILLSDLLMGFLVPTAHYEAISIAKGWLFIIVTTVILAFLLRRHHKAQKGLERRLREIIDNLPSVVYVFDRDGRSVLFNRAMAELFGVGAEEHRGKSREALGIPPATAADHRANDLRVFETGQAMIVEEEILLENRIHTYLTVKFPLTGSDGSIEAVCGVSTDISERKSLEELLRQSQKMEAIGQLAGGLAHDFNNILSVIMGYGGMLKIGANLDAQQQEKIDHIIAAAEKAAQLTSGLLSFSRKQTLTLRTVNLNDVVQHFQKFLMRTIGEDIRLQTIISKIELPVRIDSDQFEQVLVNLATNARDAMPQGGMLTIETEFQKLDATSYNIPGYGQTGSYAVITVSDSGTGMSAETRKKIFEPFFTTKANSKGTGLGMSVVYGIVKQHNGFIKLYSEPSQGTSFRIYLPLVKAEVLSLEKPPAPAPPKGGRETILVAEDEPTVRKLVESVLTDFGYKVILARDGEEVVTKFRINRGSVRLVLMDMIMPKLNGKAAAEEIWQLQPGMKILFTSGYTADFIKNRGVDEGGTEFIMKPVQPLDLLRKVREILDR